MKQISFTFFLFVLLTLQSCGGGYNYVDNEHLGKFPSVFVERSRALNELKEEFHEKAASVKSNEALQKMHQQITVKEEKINTDASNMAAKELERMKGKPVPFEFDYDETDFEVESLTIEDGHTDTGALTIKAIVKAKHPIKASTNNNLYFITMGKDGKYINKFYINPFVSIQVYTNRTFPHGTVIEAGERCNEKGSHLMLYCNSYDYTGFSHIIFVNEATYNYNK